MVQGRGIPGAAVEQVGVPPKGYTPKRVHVTPLQKFKLKTTFWMSPFEAKDVKIPKVNFNTLQDKVCEKSELVETKKPIAQSTKPA